MPLKGKTNHGLVGTRVHGSWTRMKSRCQNPGSTQWQWYGARGIRVCERWQYFPNFLEDMGMPPTEKHTIDRIDPNGNYEPGNCRWATMDEQKQNKRDRVSTVWMTYNGETLSVTEWAKKLGVCRERLFSRINLGWSVERIITEPRRAMRSKK